MTARTEMQPNSSATRTAGDANRAQGLKFGLLAAAAFLVSYFAFAYGPKLLKTSATAPRGMVLIPGGEFTMGTDRQIGWADEKPGHRVRVVPFWIDETDVTNAQFRAFVDATAYVTTAEKPVDVAEILRQSPPGTPAPPPEKLVPGSLVFHQTAAPLKDLRDFSQW